MGANTKAEIYVHLWLLGPSGLGPLTSKREITGNRKPAVFPDPVWAQAIISPPLIPIGIEYFCTGVGFRYFVRTRFLSSWGPTDSTVNSRKGSGHPSLTLTGISSYYKKLSGKIRKCEVKHLEYTVNNNEDDKGDRMSVESA